MPSLQFTDKTIKALKTNASRTDYWDKSFTGSSLGIRVYKSGKKVFNLLYRNNSGKQKRYVIGDYPIVGLSEARKKATGLLSDINDGEDPAKNRDDYRVADTFSELSEDYLELYAKKQKKTWEEDERIIKYDLKPNLGSIKVRDITKKDIIALLDNIRIKREAPIMANRVRSLLHKIFAFAVERDVVDANPVSSVKKPSKEKRKDRVLSKEEIIKFLTVLESEEEPTKTYFKVLLATAQRPGEIKALNWSDVDFKEHIFTLTAEKTKNKTKHIVPISSYVLKLLENLKVNAEYRKNRSRKVEKSSFDEFVFASPFGGHIEWLQKSCNRVVEKMKVDHFTPHDLRRTSATHIRSLGVSRDTLAKILNHKTYDNVVTGVYDKYNEGKEMRVALEKWGKCLSSMFIQQTGKVLNFKKNL